MAVQNSISHRGKNITRSFVLRCYNVDIRGVYEQQLVSAQLQKKH